MAPALDRWTLRALRRAYRSILAFCCVSLIGACELSPAGGSFSHATWEIGNTYTLQPPQHIYFCTAQGSCFLRDTGNFSVDNAAFDLKFPRTVFIHLVFDDGQTTWIAYNDFLGQRFFTPIKTSLAIRLGMTSEQIRETWGEPAEIIRQPFHGVIRQKWSYPGRGNVYFKNDKVDEIELEKSLLALS